MSANLTSDSAMPAPGVNEPIRVAVLGVGTVGQQVVAQLRERGPASNDAP